MTLQPKTSRRPLSHRRKWTIKQKRPLGLISLKAALDPGHRRKTPTSSEAGAPVDGGVLVCAGQRMLELEKTEGKKQHKTTKTRLVYILGIFPQPLRGHVKRRRRHVTDGRKKKKKTMMGDYWLGLIVAPLSSPGRKSNLRLALANFSPSPTCFTNRPIILRHFTKPRDNFIEKGFIFMKINSLFFFSGGGFNCCFFFSLRLLLLVIG